MLSRMLPRLVIIFVALGGGLVFFGAVQAQTPSDDFKPAVTDIAPEAFHTSNEARIAAAGTPAYQTSMLTAAKPFSDMMIRWQPPAPAADTLQLEVRVSNDGAKWTDWGVVDFDPDPGLPQDSLDVLWSGIIHAGEARFYQLRVVQTSGADDTPFTPGDIQVHTVDTRIPNEVLPQPQSHAELSGDMVGIANTTIARPSFVSRTQWGNPDGESAPKAPPQYYTANHLTVHHTADSNTLSSWEPNWAARVRAIWSFHAHSRGWGDIGYNWLIDPNGVIYAGRAGSTDLSRDAVGFHDAANYGSMGVSVIGTYTDVVPTTVAQNSLVNLLAWKASQRNINPLGSSFYYGCSISKLCAPYNQGSVVANIAAHRQVTPGATVCPGDKFMELLPTIRQRVSTRIQGGADNGDLIIDNLESSFSSIGTWGESACGYAGHTYWTYATNGSEGISSENNATWRPKLPTTGQYKVLVHIPQNCKISNRTTNARYQVSHANGTSAVTIDQNTTQSWVELGTFQFNAGTNGSVRLTDLTSEPYSARRVIFFDAVQWVPITPPPTPSSPAVLVSAALKSSIVAAGEVARVDFTVKNNSSAPIETQAPAGGNPSDPTTGWVYDEAECFSNKDPALNFAKVEGRLRTTLGFTTDSAKLPLNCDSGEAVYPWRWGLERALQPGETRTIAGYIRFRTPGTYKLRANLIHEWVKYYGTDGAGTDLQLGQLTVTPERNLPASIQLDGNYGPQADVFKLTPTPDSILRRSQSPLVAVEGSLVGSFAWDGREMNWGTGGPLGQTDRFIVRQVRAFYAPTSGTYRFRVTSDDGSWLWVDGKLVASNHGLHGARSVEGSIDLNAGLHRIAVKMFEHTGAAYARYDWMPPGATAFSVIPAPKSAVRIGSRFGAGQQLVLAADDMGGSGIKAIRYRINGGSEQQRTGGLLPISLGHGQYTLTYQAEDNAGNRGPWRSVSFAVDTVAPTSSLTAFSRENDTFDIYLTSPHSDVVEFEVQVRNIATGATEIIKTKQRQIVFKGKPKQTYEFRSRASDGINWGQFPSSPQARLSSIDRTKVYIPRFSR